MGGKGERISAKGKYLGEDKGFSFQGGKGLRGERAGKDPNKERGEKILGRTRGKIAGEKKALGGKEGKDLTGAGGKTS